MVAILSRPQCVNSCRYLHSGGMLKFSSITSLVNHVCIREINRQWCCPCVTSKLYHNQCVVSTITTPQNKSWKKKHFNHDDVIKWKHFPRYWPFVRGIHRSPVNSPHKGQWRGALMFTLICVWINGCVNNREAGDLIRYCAHYGVTVMSPECPSRKSFRC